MDGVDGNVGKFLSCFNFMICKSKSQKKIRMNVL
jgi:hypothetical protein